MAAGGSLEEIAREIMAGKPDTLTTAGTKFKAVADELTTLAGDIKSAAKGGTGPGVWEGADADAFLSYTDKMSGEITAAVGPLTDDNTAMTDAASALTKAQTDIQDYLQKAKTYRDQTIAAGATPDEAALAAQAEIILDKLKGKYEASTGKMKPLKPMTESGGGGGGGGAGGGGGGGPKKDPKAADPKAADPKAADPKAGDGAQPKPGGPPPATAGGPPPAAGGPPKAPTPVTKAPKIGDSSLVFNTNDPKTKPVSLGNPAKPAVGQPSDTVPLSFMTFAAGGMGSGPPAKPPVVPTKPGLPRFGDGVLAPGSSLGKAPASPPTTLTSLGRPVPVSPGEVPQVPLVDASSAATTAGAPVAPLVGSTALTGGAGAGGGGGRGKTEEEERLRVRQGVPTPMMLGGAAGGAEEGGSDRKTALEGDDDWDSDGGVDGALGRPYWLAPRPEG